MDVTTLIGTSGAAIILIAFVQSQRGKWKQTDLIYDSLNALGSALLVAYAVLLSSWPFLVLNGVWLAVSLKDIFTYFTKSKR
jgi:hypothetical protein